MMGMFNKTVLETIENFTRNIKKFVKILKNLKIFKQNLLVN